MKDEILKLKNKILKEIIGVDGLKSLEELQTKYLGRKGELAGMMKQLTSLEEGKKREIGQILNEAKKELMEKFRAARDKFTAGPGQEFVDVTLPGTKPPAGHLHPITQIQNELEDLFRSMGFMILDGSELESEYYNFEALNVPYWHPARDMQDTFYAEDIPDPATTKNSKDKKGKGLVMRTQTSPVQVRAMQKYGVPLRCVVPGRVFRNEATDAVHETTFYQLEGLMVGEGISLANLISVMKEMLNGIFDQEVKIRIRPGYFPFVEPGLEVDMACTQCGGAGCPACKHSGWLEMIGSGMVHPNVLRAGGVDPEKYSGFAFGLGVTRLAMMRYGIDDIRLFNSGDMRFLEQF